MLLPSNWILCAYTRLNETCFFSSPVLHSDSQHVLDFNTDTLPTYTHFFFQRNWIPKLDTAFAGGSNQDNLTGWTGYSEVSLKLKKYSYNIPKNMSI